jgi:hypothetical protein
MEWRAQVSFHTSDRHKTDFEVVALNVSQHSRGGGATFGGDQYQFSYPSLVKN